MRVVGTVLLVAVGLAIACMGEEPKGDDTGRPGQGGTGSAEAGSAGSDDGACAEPAVLQSPQECDAGDPGCYVLSDEWRMWGPTQLIPESTTCHALHPYDECGCPVGQAGAGGAANGGSAGDGGAYASEEIETCPAGERCIARHVSNINTVEGPGADVNECAKVCLSDDDCTAPERCVAGVCYKPACVRDSDCDRDPCGQCASDRVRQHGGATYATGSPTCVYEGTCSESSCENCYDRTQDYGVPVHGCAREDG